MASVSPQKPNINVIDLVSDLDERMDSLVNDVTRAMLVVNDENLEHGANGISDHFASFKDALAQVQTALPNGTHNAAAVLRHQRPAVETMRADLFWMDGVRADLVEQEEVFFQLTNGFYSSFTELHLRNRFLANEVFKTCPASGHERALFRRLKNEESNFLSVLDMQEFMKTRGTYRVQDFAAAVEQMVEFKNWSERIVGQCTDGAGGGPLGGTPASGAELAWPRGKRSFGRLKW